MRGVNARGILPEVREAPVGLTADLQLSTDVLGPGRPEDVLVAILPLLERAALLGYEDAVVAIGQPHLDTILSICSARFIHYFSRLVNLYQCR